jgi:hypothetical protein
MISTPAGRDFAGGRVLAHFHAARLRILQPSAQAPGLAAVDHRGVVGIVGQARIAPAQARQVGLDEGVALRARHQHVVRRHAGLATVEALAEGDALGGVLDRIAGRDERRALAAELQRHRRQVRRRRRHHALADFGRAGEQQVVEGQLREGGAERGIALHDLHLVGVEDRGEHAREQRAHGRRVFGRLDHHAVAGGERARQRHDGQLEGIVPGRDDADHAERRVAHFAARRPEGQVDRAPLRPHPLAQALAREVDLVERHQHVGAERLQRCAPAEIGRAGLHELVAVRAHRTFELLERGDALAVTGDVRQVRGAQALEGGGEAVDRGQGGVHIRSVYPCDGGRRREPRHRIGRDP